MATKFMFGSFQAYQEGPFALVKRDDLDGLWRVYHIDSTLKAMGEKLPFKQKRDALTLAQQLCTTSIDWNFTTAQEMIKLNSEAVLVEQLSPIISRGV